MQDQLRAYVNEWGFSGVLEVLSAIAEEKENIQPDERSTEKRRYGKAKEKLLRLSQKEFIQGL